MRVSLLLVVVSATTVSAQGWNRYAGQYLQTFENGYYGCWRDSMSDRVLPHEIGGAVETMQDCAVRCMGFTYFGIEDHDQCFCGNGLHLLGFGHIESDADCSSPCRRRDYYNRLWICGSHNRITVYTTEDYYTYMDRFPDDPLSKLIIAKRHLQTIENGYCGCWRDRSSNRLLSHEVGRGVQNILDCALRCRGYTYFGMEDFDQCFCGNQFPVCSQALDTDCDRLCNRPDYNNTDWICGAAGWISVYNTEDHYTYMEQFPTDPLWRKLYARQHLQTIEKGYYGCWMDSSGSRLLDHHIGRGVQNTEECAAQCVGYTFFGMEDQDQCFCGNQLDLSRSRERVSDNDCDSFCRQPGYYNNDWICGAGNRISVYIREPNFTYVKQFPEDPQTIENGYYGCWKDGDANRLLSHEIGRGVENIQGCALRCRGYTFFGMKDQDQCFCGNRLDLSRPRERVSENDCNRFCSRPGYNNTNWICGADNRITVYLREQHLTFMEQFPEDTLPKLLYARLHLQTIENGYYSCWVDDMDNRLLSHKIGRAVHQNIHDCAEQCTGFLFFGMEDQDQCFCGTGAFLRVASEQVSDDECDRLCRHPGYNNYDWICGAPGRISVYFTEDHLWYMEQVTNESFLERHWELYRMRDWIR